MGNIVVQEFRKLMGLKMNTPLHIELHQDNQHGHWGNHKCTSHTSKSHLRSAWSDLKDRAKSISNEEGNKSL